MRSRLVAGALLGLLGLTISGCFLRSLFSNVIIVSTIGEEVDEIVTTVFSDSTAAVCNMSDFGFTNCTYIVNGETVTSTFYLLGESGVAGVLIDPLLLELPAGVTDVVGTFEDGAGHGGSLVVRAGLATVPADAAQSFTAGAGKQLVVVELPDDAAVSGDYSMLLRFKQSVPKGTGGPVPLKMVLTGRVSVVGNVFYPPILPCTTDLTTVPETTLPISATSLAVALPAAPGNCSNRVYDYSAVVPQPTPTPTPVPTVTPIASAVGPMHCYAAKTAKGAPKFAPVAGVEIVDPGFGETTRFDVRKPLDLCVPADANGAGILDPATHLERYAVKPAKGEPKRHTHTGLAFTNELGTITLDAAKPTLLMVPTAKDRTVTPPTPDPNTHEIDHYLCYAAKIAKGSPKLAKGLEVTIADQLTTSTRRYIVKKVTRLCAPVEKNGEVIRHATEHLVCYQAKPTKRRCSVAAPANAGAACKSELDCGGFKGRTHLCKKSPKFAPTLALRTSNQFGAETLDARKDGELCLPSQRL